MRWRGGRESENVEDRRDEGGGDGFSFPAAASAFQAAAVGRGGGIGIVGILIILGLMWFFGIDPTVSCKGAAARDGDEGNFPDIHLPQSHRGPDTTNVPAPHYARSRRSSTRRPTARTSSSSSSPWSWPTPRTSGRTSSSNMARPTATRSSCLFTVRSSRPAVPACRPGPFYCPNDEKVYIDLELLRGAEGPVQACRAISRRPMCIAHEVGHHVQKLLGIMRAGRGDASSGRASQANALSVRLELQADCFAGIWANHAQQSKNVLEPGDIDEALNAASAIGDDTLQKQTQGYVVPDSFTHGTSAQRQRWFKRGYESGKLENCDTFNTDQL